MCVWMPGTDLSLVGRRERVGDPEAAEVAGLPQHRQPQVAHLGRAPEPDQVEVGQAGEEHEAEQPHEVHARVPDPRRVECMARAVIAQDRTEELERRDGEQHLHDAQGASWLAHRLSLTPTGGRRCRSVKSTCAVTRLPQARYRSSATRSTVTACRAWKSPRSSAGCPRGACGTAAISSSLNASAFYFGCFCHFRVSNGLPVTSSSAH